MSKLKQARKRPRVKGKVKSLSSNRAKSPRKNWLEVTDETVMMSPTLRNILS